jgi:hypothetical protein
VEKLSSADGLSCMAQLVILPASLCAHNSHHASGTPSPLLLVLPPRAAATAFLCGCQALPTAQRVHAAYGGLQAALLQRGLHNSKCADSVTSSRSIPLDILQNQMQFRNWLGACCGVQTASQLTQASILCELLCQSHDLLL